MNDDSLNQKDPSGNEPLQHSKWKGPLIAVLCIAGICVAVFFIARAAMIAGFRVGWMILSGNKEIARDYMEGLKMLSSMRLCSNVPAQSIIQTSLGGHQSVNDYVCPTGRVTQQRDFIIKALGEIPGVSVVKPKAAFYCFPKLDTERFGIHEPLIRMSKRSGISTGLSITIRLVAVVLALVVSGLVIFAIVKLNPVDVYIAMVNITHNISDAAARYKLAGNYVAGANIAGFEKLVAAMIAQGIV